MSEYKLIYFIPGGNHQAEQPSVECRDDSEVARPTRLDSGGECAQNRSLPSNTRNFGNISWSSDYSFIND